MLSLCDVERVGIRLVGGVHEVGEVVVLGYPGERVMLGR